MTPVSVAALQAALRAGCQREDRSKGPAKPRPQVGPHRETKGLQQINGPLIATKENAVSLLIFIGSWSPLGRKQNREVYNSIYAMSSKEHYIWTDVLKGLLTRKRQCLERLRASAPLGLSFLPYLLPAMTVDKCLLQSGRQGSCLNNEGRNGT